MPDDARESLRATLRWAGAALVDEMTLVIGPTGPPGPQGDTGPPGPIDATHEPRITQLEEDVMTLRSAIAALQQTGPATGPGPGPTAPIILPASADTQLRGDPTFTTASLDDTTPDEFGVTTREWYTRMKTSMALGTRDSEFGSSNRPWGRTGNATVTGLLIAFRYTGDLTLLDEAVRLVERAWSNRSGVDGIYTYWTGYDQELDVPLTAGLIACVAWACRNNDDLTSPAGHDYDALATKYHEWLLSSFIERWRLREGTSATTLPPFHKGQQHTFVNMMRVLWYVGRLGGGNGNSGSTFAAAAQAMLTVRLAEDNVAATGFGGRNTRMYKHSVSGDESTANTASALQYTTYMRYEVPAYIDLMLDGFDARLDATFFTEWANGIADFAFDGDPEGTGSPMARSVGGDLVADATSCSGYTPSLAVNRNGLPYHHCFQPSRTDADRLMQSTYGFLEGWDSRGRIASTLNGLYPRFGTASAPSYPDYPAGRFFTLMFHG